MTKAGIQELTNSYLLLPGLVQKIEITMVQSIALFGIEILGRK